MKINNHSMRLQWSGLILLLLVCLSLPETALASMTEDNLVDQIMQTYSQAARNWQQSIRDAAVWMFWTLAVIELTWTGITLFLRAADLGEVLAEITFRVLALGFFAGLLQFGPEWAARITDSFAQLAGRASAAGGGSDSISPAALFDSGIVLGSKLWNSIPGWDSTTDSTGLLFAGLFIITLFALMAAQLVVVFAEMWIVVNAGIILLGFGASRFSRDFALKYIIYALSVGLKLFTLFLIVGIGQSLISEWILNWVNNDTQVLLAVGSSVVLLALIREVPGIMQGLISGMSFNTGESLVRRSANTPGGVSTGGALGIRNGTSSSLTAIAAAVRGSNTTGTSSPQSSVATASAAVTGSPGNTAIIHRPGHTGSTTATETTGDAAMSAALKTAQRDLRQRANSYEKG
ncbi:MAG: P-type conjugative transfer protein TrbL [Sedimenticola sp.]